MYNDILNSTAHRDYQLPEGRWLMTQKWNDLLFIHIPVAKNILDAEIPDGLELDTFKGTAWVSIIPFKISNMHLRKIPPFPFLHSFLEINVRTYVKCNGVPGVYFFSMDANNLSAVLGARFASLPYFYSKMNMVKKKDIIYYNSERKGGLTVNFEGAYKPISQAYYPKESSLSYWLVERYYLWSDRNNSLFRGEIHHKQWKLQDVEATIKRQNMLPGFPDDKVIGNPIFHYAHAKRVLIWPLKKQVKNCKR